MELRLPSFIVLAALAGCVAPGLHPTGTTDAADGGVRAGARGGPNSSDAGHSAPGRLVQRTSPSRPDDGDIEVTFSAQAVNDEDFEVGVGTINAGVGYYLSDGLEIVGRQSASFSDVGPGADVWDGSTRVGLDYNFDTQPVIPYVGVLFGWVYGDSVDETLTAGPEGGLKWYVKDEAFIQLSVEYQFFFDENDVVGDAVEDGQFVYGIGFGLKF